MSRDIKKIISQLTLEEKAGLCSGFDMWNTRAVDRLGIPSIMMTDGPHGLRKQIGEMDPSGVNTSVPATCFPSGAALACSWDRKLIEKIGEALGEECQANDVSILLGPGANIKRSPLCGRNFEYFSEDPYLSSEMAASHIRGVQSMGVGTCLKHFAVNNQEQKRMVIDAVVDERTLREIYLASFEGAVKKSQPWAMMCSYNKVNGEYCCESKKLLTDILKEEWGHEGFVVSDWGAVDERVECLRAGLELEMPSSGGAGDKKIIEAVKSGKLEESVLDNAVERLLTIVFKAADNKKNNSVYDKEAHHRLARQAAAECAVLLKNEDDILPLKKKGTIALIGAFAKQPRYQGGGSSRVNPTILDNEFAEIEKIAGKDVKILYADGYKTDESAGLFISKPFISNSDIADKALIDEAKKAAKKSDVAVIFAGLPENYESEGFDRKHMRIPEGHRALIEAVAEVQKKTVVVLSNGSPIEMPWLCKVKGVLELYLGGQASGGAVADLLFGLFNPCGKLAETFPKRLNDNPSYLNFPGESEKVEYREGLFVGYRYYDSAHIEPLFPFGYGLSYTHFDYIGISVSKKEIKSNETIDVMISIKNTGSVKGKEIVQLYVRDIESSVIRPVKELKGFEKVELDPGEEKTVTISLGERAFAYYHPGKNDWYVESGSFEIIVGRSSDDIVLRETIKVKSVRPIKRVFTRNTPIGEILADPAAADILKQSVKLPFGLGEKNKNNDDNSSNGMALIVKDTPLRSIAMFNPSADIAEKIDEVLEKLNKGAFQI